MTGLIGTTVFLLLLAAALGLGTYLGKRKGRKR